MLNLVVTPEKEEGNDDPFFKKEKKRKKYIIGVLTLFDDLNVLSNFAGRL